jgi:hypothetical protein
MGATALTRTPRGEQFIGHLGDARGIRHVHDHALDLISLVRHGLARGGDHVPRKIGDGHAGARLGRASTVESPMPLAPPVTTMTGRPLAVELKAAAFYFGNSAAGLLKTR